MRPKLKFVQTDIKITTYIEYATGTMEERQKMKETRRINFSKVDKKINQLSENVYEHGSIIRFPWSITKEYTI